VPAYYDWRSRSGCYFCFYQRRSEWVGLLENHPDLFEKAKAYEREDPATGDVYSWNSAEPLSNIERPERIEEIKRRTAERAERVKQQRGGVTLLEQFFDEVRDAEDDGAGCSICHL